MCPLFIPRPVSLSALLPHWNRKITVAWVTRRRIELFPRIFPHITRARTFQTKLSGMLLLLFKQTNFVVFCFLALPVPFSLPDPILHSIIKRKRRRKEECTDEILRDVSLENPRCHCASREMEEGRGGRGFSTSKVQSWLVQVIVTCQSHFPFFQKGGW